MTPTTRSSTDEENAARIAANVNGSRVDEEPRGDDSTNHQTVSNLQSVLEGLAEVLKDALPKSEIVKVPLFYGKKGECVERFVKLFDNAIEVNKWSGPVAFSKLNDVLRDAAKNHLEIHQINGVNSWQTYRPILLQGFQTNKIENFLNNVLGMKMGERMIPYSLFWKFGRACQLWTT